MSTVWQFDSSRWCNLGTKQVDQEITRRLDYKFCATTPALEFVKTYFLCVIQKCATCNLVISQGICLVPLCEQETHETSSSSCAIALIWWQVSNKIMRDDKTIRNLGQVLEYEMNLITKEKRPLTNEHRQVSLQPSTQIGSSSRQNFISKILHKFKSPFPLPMAKKFETHRLLP